MKLLSIKDMRLKKPAELTKYIAEARRERTTLIESIATGKSKETHRLSQLKKTVAQVNTILSQAQVEAKKEEKK